MLPAYDNLLTILQGELVASGTESGRTVLVSGDPGSGKTMTLRTFVDHAEKTGALVLSGAGTPDEQPLRAGVLEQLISNTRIPEKTRETISGLISSIDSDDIHFIHGVGTALLDLSRGQPVVIAVDDAHFADRWSVRLLCHLHRRIRSTRLLIVLTRWTRADAAPSPLAELAALACRRVRLDPGSLAAVADQESPVDTLHAALSEWGRPLSEVSRAIAILAEQADAESVARFVGGPASIAEDMIGVLERLGLVADGRFRRASVGSTVLAELSADERVRLHGRAATVAYRLGRGTRASARHLLAAGRTDPGWPVDVLREAAEQAASSDDVGFAVSCLELALTVAAEERDRIEIRAALARAAWRCDPGLASRTMPPLHDAVRSGDGPVDMSALVVRDALWHGDRESLPDALARLRSADPQTHAEIRLACLWHFGSNDVVPEPADATDSPWPRVTEALADGWLNGAGGSAGDKAATSAELVLRSCRLTDLSLEALAIALCVLPDGAEAERWCARLRDEAAERGAVTWSALLGSVHAMLRLCDSDPVAAGDEAAAALRMLSAESWGAAIGFPLAVLVLARTEAGDHDAAADALRVPVPAAMFGTLNGLRYLHARGCHHLASNRVLAAIDDFQRCRRHARAWDDGLAELVPWPRDLANAMARLSEQLDRAEPIQGNGNENEVGAEIGDDRSARPAKSWTARLTSPVTRAYDHAAPRLTARVHGESAVQADSQDTAELSEAERRVAELAAVGLSNRQISGDLYVTVSTVEQHLTRVYKKLGVAGRGGLAARLGPAAG